MARSPTTVQRQTIPVPGRPKAAAERTGANAARRSNEFDKSRPMARLLIVHPEMDPALITDKLGIQPSQSSRHGQPRVTPKGTTLPGTYTDTRWCMSFRNDENRSIEALVVHALAVLPAKSKFWGELVRSGGKAELILSLGGSQYQGASLKAETIRQLAQMGMQLGLEVYPEPQGG